ncbi:hypothetical protein CRYUN_Cryun12cG0036200 [Craigia yunnanensis]
MKLVCSPIPALVICVVALLVLKSLSTSISKHFNLEFSYSPLSRFILVNAITVAVIVGSKKPSIDEFGVFPYFFSLYEVGASFDNTEECSDVNVIEDDTSGSDGYHEMTMMTWMTVGMMKKSMVMICGKESKTSLLRSIMDAGKRGSRRKIVNRNSYGLGN